MSSVYRAHDRLLARKVALKVLHEHYGADEAHVERFRREARAVATLSHPNIVAVIDRGEHEGSQFIVFEYVEGENLKRLIEREGPLPVATRARAGDPDRARPLVRARAGARPPRRQAAERAAERRRRGEGDRLRDRSLARRAARDDPDRHGARHLRLHRARAGAGPARRRALRHLLARRRALRAADDQGAVPGENFVAVAMRHINEPPPSVRDERPDVPLRVDAALQTAMAKDPATASRRWRRSATSSRRASRELQLRTPTGRRSSRRPGARGATAVSSPVAGARADRRAARDRRGRRGTRPDRAHAGRRPAARGGGGGAGRTSPRSPPTTRSGPAASTTSSRTSRPTATTRRSGRPSTTTTRPASPASPASGSSSTPGRTVALHQLTIATSTPGFVAVIKGGDSPTSFTHGRLAPRRPSTTARRFSISGGRSATTRSGSRGSARASERARSTKSPQPERVPQRDAARRLAAPVPACTAAEREVVGLDGQPRARRDRHLADELAARRCRTERRARQEVDRPRRPRARRRAGRSRSRRCSATGRRRARTS